MKTVHVLVKLVIDSDDENEIDNIIQEMDYHFSNVKMDCPDNTNLIEKDRILKTEILEHETIS